jgi:uncharacterized protein YqeY
MSLKRRIEDDIKQALKAGDRPRLSCLRMLKSKLQEREVARRSEQGRDYELSDDESQAVIASYAKQRRDSIAGFEQGGRDDLAERERAELEVVGAYLPQQLSDEELRRIVQEAIGSTGATSAREMGAVMKIVMATVRGGADGKRVSGMVRELLDGG